MCSEDDLLPISALQHMLFCERQCALIHVERQWEENRWTAEGQVLHKKAHEGKPETRDGERITRGLQLRSFTLGLTGVADIILWKPSAAASTKGKTIRQAIVDATVEELRQWSITPVEYKRGKPKKNHCDRVQLCAQAMCLEEMLGVEISTGQIYYGTKHRRFDVSLDDELRSLTAETAMQFHAMMDSGLTPAAQYAKKCDTCSLLLVCLPSIAAKQDASRYLSRQLSAANNEF